MTDDLLRWLGEQLDEEERVARAAGGRWRELSGNWVTASDVDHRVAMVLAAAERAHIVAHDPARVLREIEAKRELLKEHTVDGWTCSTCAMPEDFDEDADGNREWSRRGQDFPCRTLRLAASVYADRPGYREDWRP
jgi:hypothetical protein